jgi:SAM-dependent methyltransferase
LLCGPGTAFRVKYAQRLPATGVDFAARRTPCRIHFRIVQCSQCGLVFSNPIYPRDEILQLYRSARYIVEPQLDNMLKDYVRQLQRAIPLVPSRRRLLEIGCASGFFLKAARAAGFEEVVGVEPGRQAVENADAEIRGAIINDIFHAERFEAESFDCVCLFQVLDHLLDPLAFMKEVFQVLRPGGILLAVNHNIRSWFARALGERCPMYDVEHIYLFSPATVAGLLANCGFQVQCARGIATSYTCQYALKMFPLPQWLRTVAAGLVSGCGLKDRSIPFYAGNMVAIGAKPGTA